LTIICLAKEPLFPRRLANSAQGYAQAIQTKLIFPLQSGSLVIASTVTGSRH
jgi:hypothetical protein